MIRITISKNSILGKICVKENIKVTLNKSVNIFKKLSFDTLLLEYKIWVKDLFMSVINNENEAIKIPLFNVWILILALLKSNSGLNEMEIEINKAKIAKINWQ